MFRGDRAIPLDHAQGLPPAFLPDGLEIDPGHHAPARPVVPPVVHVELIDPGPRTGGLMCPADRAAAGQLVPTWIGIWPPYPVQEYTAFGRRPTAHPEPVQGFSHPRVDRHGAGVTGLGLRNEQAVA